MAFRAAVGRCAVLPGTFPQRIARFVPERSVLVAPAGSVRPFGRPPPHSGKVVDIQTSICGSLRFPAYRARVQREMLPETFEFR